MGWTPFARAAAVVFLLTGCAPTPTPAPVAPAPVIHLAGGIDVDRSRGELRVPALVACTAGWLEQVACTPGTREHEALLVVDAKPSDIHAGLLLLGLQPGAPGRWSYDGDSVAVEPPRGDAIEPWVRVDEQGVERERSLAEWIRGADGREFPAHWVFAGSRFVPNPPAMGPGEHYQADSTGSLVGLVTFGDETVAAKAVIPDQISIEAANWQSWTERMPKEGAAVTLILRRAR